MFLTLLIASIAALIAATAIGFAIFAQTQNSANWMSQMWLEDAQVQVQTAWAA